MRQILSKDGKFVLQPDGRVYELSGAGWIRRKDIEIQNQIRMAKIREGKSRGNLGQ